MKYQHLNKQNQLKHLNNKTGLRLVKMKLELMNNNNNIDLNKLKLLIKLLLLLVIHKMLNFSLKLRFNEKTYSQKYKNHKNR